MRVSSYYCIKDVILCDIIIFHKDRIYSALYYEEDWGVYLVSNDLLSGITYLFTFDKAKYFILYLHEYFIGVDEMRNNKIDKILCQ